jgi:carbon-monoxide dehydrogenase iron sulfur subunit
LTQLKKHAIIKNTASGCRMPYIVYQEKLVSKVIVNEEVCMGCGLCQVHCQVCHSKTQDILKAFKKETRRPLSRVRVERKGDISFSLQCRHCDQPWCVYSCLTGALQKDPVSGTVTLDDEKCMGCWTCIVACPNGALARDVHNGYVVKCDLCTGQDIPVCVRNCPNEALSVDESKTTIEE